MTVRPSVDQVIRDPVLYEAASMQDYSFIDGARILGGHKMRKAKDAFYTKSHGVEQLQRDKRWVNNLISRVNDLTSREERSIGSVDLSIAKKGGKPFLEEKSLQLLHRLATLVEELSADDGSLDLSHPKIDPVTGLLLIGEEVGKREQELELKLELRQKLQQAAELGCALPPFSQGNLQLKAEETKSFLTGLRARTGVETDQAWKDLRERLEVRKLLREAREKGYETGKLDFDKSDLILSKELKADLVSNLRDRVLTDIDQEISRGCQEIDRIFQERTQAMQLMQYMIKMYGEMMRTPARNIAGR